MKQGEPPAPMTFPLEVAEDVASCSAVICLRAVPELHGISIHPGDAVILPDVWRFGKGRSIALPLRLLATTAVTIGELTMVGIHPYLIEAGDYRNVDRLPAAGDRVWTCGEYSTARLCGMPEREIEMMQAAAKLFIEGNR